jgi:hypothetical protein
MRFVLAAVAGVNDRRLLENLLPDARCLNSVASMDL